MKSIVFVSRGKTKLGTRRRKVLKLHLQTSQRAASWKGGGSANIFCDLRRSILLIARFSDSRVDASDQFWRRATTVIAAGVRWSSALRTQSNAPFCRAQKETGSRSPQEFALHKYFLNKFYVLSKLTIIPIK